MLKIFKEDDKAIIQTKYRGISETVLREFPKFEETKENSIYKIDLLPYNCFSLFFFIKKYFKHIETDKEFIDEIKLIAQKTGVPKAYMLNEKTIAIDVPSIYSYSIFMKSINAKHLKMNTWVVPVSRTYEAYRLLNSFSHDFLPNIPIKENVHNFALSKITNKENLEELFSEDVKNLFSVENAYFRVNKDGFSKLNYNTLSDLVLKRPERYVDRKDVYLFNDAPYGLAVYFKGVIISSKNNFSKSTIKIKESNGNILDFVFFTKYTASLFKENETVYIKGIKTGRKEIQGIEILSEFDVKALPISPIYKQSPTNKINNNLLINCVNEVFYRFDGSNLIPYIKNTTKPFWNLLKELHFPLSADSYSKTIDELAYIELFFLQLKFLNDESKKAKNKGIPKSIEEPILTKKAINSLPFKLTKGQIDGTKEIFNKLRTTEFENMLLTSDVGSGKTVLSCISAMYTIECGYQVAMAAPTEILAQQLYSSFISFIEPLKDKKPTVAYLSSATKSKEKKIIENNLRNGNVDIVIGTHSLFNVEYKNLGLIIIDEQQKFGTNQREKLLNSRKDGKVPDLLSQTATPIPRSTALAFYGNINLISLTDKPQGRKENITELVNQSVDDFMRDNLGKVWSHIFKEIENGHQIFIVTPAVEESAKVASVKEISKVLENKFKDIKIDKVHGQLSKETQNKIIEKFRKNETQILVASSIIEVGVNIPNATIMLVLDAHRFGASSLHQIRGRVGRSDLQGYCYLISSLPNENSVKRLNSLVDFNDGFKISLVDLETRKEGDLFGTKQSGFSTMRFCNLTNHTDMIEIAKKEALKVFNSKDREQALKDANIFLGVGKDE